MLMLKVDSANRARARIRATPVEADWMLIRKQLDMWAGCCQAIFSSDPSGTHMPTSEQTNQQYQWDGSNLAKIGKSKMAKPELN